MAIFRGIDYYEFKSKIEEEIKKEIEELSENELVNSDDSLMLILLAKYSCRPIKLREYYKSDGGEVDKDVSQDFMRAIIDPTKPYLIKAKRINIHIPFEGNPEFLRIHPTSFSRDPKGDIVNNEIIFQVDYLSDSQDVDSIKKEITYEIENISKYTQNMNNDLNTLNELLQNYIMGLLKRRREKVRKDKEIFDSIDIPSNQPQKQEPVFKFAEKKHQIKIEHIKDNINQFPSIALSLYRVFIDTIYDLGVSLERCSHRVRSLDEESLRDLLLMGLNGVFGFATGEAFNKNGKTDILIRFENQNLFISECKFWKGKKYFMEGLSQLINNLTIRDSKASLIVFVKDNGFSEIVQKAKNLIISHEQYLDTDEEINDTTVLYKLKRDINSQDSFYLSLQLVHVAV